MRDGNPANMQNWRVVCSVCGAEWGAKEQIALVEGHAATDHPDREMPEFTLIWCGKGPAPRKNANGGFVGRTGRGRR